MLPRLFAKDEHLVDKKGRRVVIERYGARGDQHIYYIRNTNGNQSGRGSWVSESTLTNKFERTERRE